MRSSPSLSKRTLITLLFLATVTIRSGIIVDASYLPRFLLLATTLTGCAMWLMFRPGKITVSLYDIAFLAFYLWNLLSASWATVPSEAIAQAQLVFLSLVLFWFGRMAFTRDQRSEKTFIVATLLALAISFGLAFYRMSTLQFFDPYRIISISANNNLFAGFLLISLPVALAGYKIFNGVLKYISLTMATVALFFIVITQSRAVYLGLFFALGIFLLFLLLRYRSLVSGKNVRAGICALVFLFVGIMIFYLSLDQTRRSYFLSKIPVWQYFRSYNDDLKKIQEEQNRQKATLNGMATFDFSASYYQNANLRMIFWKKSAVLIASRPLLGTGSGNWRIMVPSCPKPDNPEHTYKNYTYSQPHNEWIAITAELGFPGLTLAVIVFIFPLILLFRKVLSHENQPDFTTVIYASFIAGFCLFACFDFPFRRVEHNLVLFLVMAVMMAKEPLFPPKFSLEGKPARLAAFLLLAGLIFTMYAGFMRMKGEYYTGLVFRNEGKDDRAVINFATTAENAFYKLTPNALPLQWFAGVARFHSGDKKTAILSFREALRITPYEVRVINDYATALYADGQTPEAMAQLLRCVTLDPFFDDARFNLAAICFYQGDLKTAQSLVNGCRESEKKRLYLRELR